MLLVPSASSAAAASPSGGADYLTPEDQLYGADLLLDPDSVSEGQFDIGIRRYDDNLDAAVVTGVPNVVQGTQITISTEQGATAYVPDIGIRRTAGGKNTLQNLLVTSVRLREAILSDPRITGIQSMRVVIDGDVLSQEITPIVAGQKTGATLILPFGRASGGGS